VHDDTELCGFTKYINGCISMPTDINECEQNTDGCEQDCTNFDGGYNCTCGSQYALATDLHNCLGKPFHMHALLCLVNHAGCFKFPLERGKLPF